VQHPRRGMYKTVGCSLVLSDSPVEVQTAPLLGEHTEEILTGLLGYDKAMVDQLRVEGVI
jgi:formyl-CoA transferase